MNLLQTIIPAAIFLFSTSTFSQQPALQFTPQCYTTVNGLAGNDVVKTVADERGFLWIATHNGISRFDGREFKNYSHIPGDTTTLRSIWVTDIITGPDNTLWATTEWGVCYYDKLLDRFRYINQKDSITTLYKAPLTTDSKGNIWMAAENGLYKINRHTKSISHTSLKRLPDPQCITEDAVGNLLIGTRGNGLFLYFPSTDLFVKINTAGVGPKVHYMYSLRLNKEVWLATDEGLLNVTEGYRTQLYTQISNTLPVNAYRQLLSFIVYRLQDKPFFLISTYDKRLLLFDIEKKIFTPLPANGIAGFLSSTVYHIQQYQNSTWLATQSGLCRITAARADYIQKKIPVTASNGIPIIAKRIIPDNRNSGGYLIFSEQDNGTLIFYNPKDETVLKKINTKPGTVSENNGQCAILQKKTGTIYTFANKSIHIFSAEGHLITQLESGYEVFAACFDEEENIWAATGEGLLYFNTQTNRFTHYVCNFTGTDIEQTSFINAFGGIGISNQNETTVWLASIKYGLFSFNKKTGQFTPHRQPFTGPYETLNRCSDVIYANDTVWVSNMAGLTAFLPSSGKFINYNLSHGLKSSYVYSIARSPTGIIWGRGNMGIFSFEPATKNFTNYSLPDAFNESYFLQHVITEGETCLLGLPGSISRFEKKERGYDTIKAVFTGLSVRNHAAIVTDEKERIPFTTLTHTKNDIRIDFTAIEFSGKPVYYSHMLTGLDEKWSAASEKNQVNYSGLKPGTYTLSVKCRVGESEWGPATNLLRIKIKAAFWQTNWFKILLALSILTVTLSFYQWRIKQLKRRQKEKNKFQQLQLEQYKQELETEQITGFFSNSLLDKKNIQEVLTDVAKNLIGKLGFEDCMIYLWNADKTTLIQYAGHGTKGAIENTADKEKYHIPAGRGIIGAAVNLKQPLVVNDTSADPRYVSVDGLIRYSELCVPVMDNDEVMGAINIEYTQKNYFTRHHVQTVTTIAALVASKLKAIVSTGALHQKQLELAEASKQLAESEVAMLRSQMNPHFIFNSLNSVQKYIWENKEEDAAEYLASFARLMRSILENSRHEYIPLKEETDFLKLYIDLEHRRSNNSFNYTIKIDETLDTNNILIPPMLLQPFIENAIWHGLNKKTSKGNLFVHIYKAGGSLVCVVDDDGVGRQQPASKLGEKKSLGISITQQRIERLMENTSRAASVVIKDKTTNGTPAGTEVTVTLPIHTKVANA